MCMTQPDCTKHVTGGGVLLWGAVWGSITKSGQIHVMWLSDGILIHLQ